MVGSFISLARELLADCLEGMALRPQETAHIDNLQRSLGRRIRELRSEHEWTQEQFAEVCGLHRTYMGHVERGEKNVSLSTVLRVANALGVRISVLFGRAQETPEREMAKPSVPLTKPSAADASKLSRLDVNMIVNELRSQRKTLRQVVRDLSHFLARFSSPASSRQEPVEQ